MMHRMFVLGLVMAVALVGATACGGGSEGADSPEAAFEMLKEGMENEDYQQVLNSMTEESRAYFTFGMVGLAMMPIMFAEMMPAGEGEEAEKLQAHFKKFDDILKKHSLDKDELIEKDEDFDPTDFYNELSDPAGLIGDALQWLKDMPRDDDASAPDFSDQMGGTIEDLEEEGDKATAKIVDGDRSQPIEFKRVGGRWFVDLSSEFK